jgi:hypothetical protein
MCNAGVTVMFEHTTVTPADARYGGTLITACAEHSDDQTVQTHMMMSPLKSQS